MGIYEWFNPEIAAAEAAADIAGESMGLYDYMNPKQSLARSLAHANGSSFGFYDAYNLDQSIAQNMAGLSGATFGFYDAFHPIQGAASSASVASGGSFGMFDHLHPWQSIASSLRSIADDQRRGQIQFDDFEEFGNFGDVGNFEEYSDFGDVDYAPSYWSYEASPISARLSKNEVRYQSALELFAGIVRGLAQASGVLGASIEGLKADYERVTASVTRQADKDLIEKVTEAQLNRLVKKIDALKDAYHEFVYGFESMTPSKFIRTYKPSGRRVKSISKVLESISHQ